MDLTLGLNSELCYSISNSDLNIDTLFGYWNNYYDQVIANFEKKIHKRNKKHIILFLPIIMDWSLRKNSIMHFIATNPKDKYIYEINKLSNENGIRTFIICFDITNDLVLFETYNKKNKINAVHEFITYPLSERFIKVENLESVSDS